MGFGHEKLDVYSTGFRGSIGGKQSIFYVFSRLGVKNWEPQTVYVCAR